MSPKPQSHLSRIRPYQPGRPIESVKREFGLSTVIKLASNENPLGPSPKALKAAQAALKRVHRYPEGDAHVLRGKLAGVWGLGPEHFVFGNGSNEILIFAAQAFAGPGSGIAFSERSFAVYEIAARLCGADELRVPSPEFTHDLDALAQAAQKASLVFVCNPNNPTGSWHSPAAIEAFLRKVPQQCLVVLDEAYAEFAGQFLTQDKAWLSSFPNLLICRTFSKIYGLAGLRVGYGVASKEICQTLEKCRQPFNVNLPAQEAAIAALDDAAFVKKTLKANKAGMKQIEAFFQRRGIWYVPSRTNFLFFLEPVKRLGQWLLERGLIVRPIEEGYLRVTIGTPEENARFLKLMQQRLK